LSNDDSYPFDSASDYPAREIAAAWTRERPGTPTSSIEVVTPLWRLAKLFGDDRRRVLADADVTPATLDLLSVLRRSGPPYTVDTRELAARTLVTAGAISQRVGKAEKDGLVTRSPGTDRARSVLVTLTEAGHALIERTVDQVLTREASLLDGLGAEQRRQLGELLAALLDQVRGKVG
jgi:DNA-binding MarR family transcriptional regulator